MHGQEWAGVLPDRHLQAIQGTGGAGTSTRRGVESMSETKSGEYENCAYCGTDVPSDQTIHESGYPFCSEACREAWLVEQDEDEEEGA